MGAIVGLGLDVVDVARFEQSLASAPRLAERVLVPAERALPVRSMAARFAAKEALAKALGAPGNLRWLDCWVEKDPAGRPSLVCQGTVADRLNELGITNLQLSLTHDAGLAAAVVIAER